MSDSELPDPTVGSTIRGAFSGCALGGLLALVCLAVGAIRLVIAAGSGANPSEPSAGDMRMLGYYMGGFIAGGIVVGALRPWARSTLAQYGRYAAGGVMAMAMIAAGNEGSWSALSRGHWVAVLALGSAFGSALLWGMRRRSG